MTVYRMISAEKASTPVSVCCALLGVSRSGDYDWERRAPSDRALSDAWLIERIREIWAENRKVYGSPRIHADLRLRYGIPYIDEAVHRGDIALIELIGLIAAMVSGVVGLRNLRGTSTPYSLGVALALVKIPLGALPCAPLPAARIRATISSTFGGSAG